MENRIIYYSYGKIFFYNLKIKQFRLLIAEYVNILSVNSNKT